MSRSSSSTNDAYGAPVTCCSAISQVRLLHRCSSTACSAQRRAGRVAQRRRRQLRVQQAAVAGHAAAARRRRARAPRPRAPARSPRACPPGPAGRPSTSGGRRPLPPCARTSSRGSSRSCAHAIESSTSICSKRSRSASAEARRDLLEQAHARTSSRRSRPAARRRRSSATAPPRSWRPCGRGRGGSPSSSTASRSSARRRPSGIHTGSPARAETVDERLGQRRAAPRRRGGCRRCG